MDQDGRRERRHWAGDQLSDATGCGSPPRMFWSPERHLEQPPPDPWRGGWWSWKRCQCPGDMVPRRWSSTVWHIP